MIENTVKTNTMDKIKLSDYVFKQLALYGVEKIFGVPGGGCMHLFDSASNTPGLEVIPAFHEQSAAFAAQSYSEIKNDIGVCLVTAGPGLTNTVTGIAACWMESTSGVFIGGQAKTSDLSINLGVRTMGQQELDGVSIVKSITKYAKRIDNPNDIYEILNNAIVLSTTGRKGPVFIEIPLDIQSSIIDDKVLNFKNLELINKSSVNEKIYAELITDIKNSRKPVLLAGAGVKASNSFKTLIKFCEKFQIPILLTWKVVGLLAEDHYLNYGRPGNICQPYSNDILQNADLFISIGARNDLVSVAFNYDEYAISSLNRYFIDIDEKELQKYNLEKDKKINVDIADFFESISNICNDIEDNKSKLDWLEQCKSEKKSKNILNYHVTDSNFASTYKLIDELSDLIHSDSHTIIPGSSGSCSDIFMQTFRTKGSVCIQNAPGLGAMGTGLPAILGAAAARPDTQIISIIGDGGFQFNLQELQTIKNREINCAIFVLNNDGYASIRRSQLTHFKRKAHADKESSIKLSQLDLVAKCFGFKFYILKSNQQISSLLNEILNINDQIIIEVIVDPNEDVRPRVGAKIVGGKIISANLKDYK